MAVEKNMVDWHALRPALLHLQWGEGLVRDEMMNQSPPSVGGGYGSGDTGSSAQTGVGREGTSTHQTRT